MAIVGHWCVAFLLGWLMPNVSTTSLCKLTMLSDTLLGVFGILGRERAGIYVNWMSTPPPGTQHLIEEWKSTEVWKQGVDVVDGQGGFRGWVPCCFPLYTDISYSHSVEFMAIAAVPIVIVCCLLRRKISVGYAFAIFLAMTSHPVMDMIFHEAYFRMGDRSKSRVSFELWQIPYNAPFTFLLECILAYATFRLWISSREPVCNDIETGDALSYYQKAFLSISVTHNMFSWYVLAPILPWVFYNVAPEVGYLADTTWSYWFIAATVFSWAMPLYPLYKLEGLTMPRTFDKGEVPYSHLKV